MTDVKNLKVYIIAGEPSGDLLEKSVPEKPHY